ncbi:MAG TPA: ATP-binding protein, partial [Deinococcales bacterium]|nr:ATP-binding protein [Deinococcales bacterium]
MPDNTPADRVGIVLGTEPAGPLEFEFAVADGCSVQLDEVVAVDVADPADRERTISFYGVVDDVTRRFEGVHFDGDTRLVTEGTLPAHVSYVAKVRTTRVEPEEFIPPAPGDPVRLARGDSLRTALFADRMERSIPAGVLRNGEAAWLNLDFIDGTKGAHINISGISGVATKTSYALFLLYSLFNARTPEDGLVLPEAANSRAVIFNVKGHDLFWLDRPNNRLEDSEAEWAQRNGLSGTDRYQLLGLPAAPFDSVQVRSPALPAARSGADLLPEMQDDPRVLPYCFSLREFAADGLLPYMLTSQGDLTNLAFLTDSVTGRLEQLA